MSEAPNQIDNIFRVIDPMHNNMIKNLKCRIIKCTRDIHRMSKSIEIQISDIESVKSTLNIKRKTRRYRQGLDLGCRNRDGGALARGHRCLDSIVSKWA